MNETGIGQHRNRHKERPRGRTKHSRLHFPREGARLRYWPTHFPAQQLATSVRSTRAAQAQRRAACRPSGPAGGLERQRIAPLPGRELCEHTGPLEATCRAGSPRRGERPGTSCKLLCHRSFPFPLSFPSPFPLATPAAEPPPGAPAGAVRPCTCRRRRRAGTIPRSTRRGR